MTMRRCPSIPDPTRTVHSRSPQSRCALGRAEVNRDGEALRAHRRRRIAGRRATGSLCINVRWLHVCRRGRAALTGLALLDPEPLLLLPEALES